MKEREDIIMPKSKEELNKLREEYKTLSVKLKELTADELKQVIGGVEFVTSGG